MVINADIPLKSYHRGRHATLQLNNNAWLLNPFFIPFGFTHVARRFLGSGIAPKDGNYQLPLYDYSGYDTGNVSENAISRSHPSKTNATTLSHTRGRKCQRFCYI